MAISSTKTKWQRAVNMIPSSENIHSRYFMVIGGNLFFVGDKSWFRVTNFMKSDVDFRISHKHMVTVMGMTGEISALKIDEHRIRFSNGKQNLAISYTAVEGDLQMKTPPDESFYEIESIYHLSRNIFGLAGPGSIVGAVDIEGQGHVAMVSTTLMAGAIGKINFEMDLTANTNVIRTAISNQADIVLGEKMVFFKLPGADYTIHSALKYSRPNLSDKARAHALALSKKAYEPTPDENNVVISVKVQELNDVFPVLESISYNGWIDARVTKDGLTISASDGTNVDFEGTVPCESTSDCRFKCMMITKPMLDFLVATQEPAKDVSIKLHLNLSQQLLVARPIKVDPNAPDAYIMMKVTQPTALEG